MKYKTVKERRGSIFPLHLPEVKIQRLVVSGLRFIIGWGWNRSPVIIFLFPIPGGLFNSSEIYGSHS